MANKKTAVITDEQFQNIVRLINNGDGNRIKPNKSMALALIVTGNCGLRIGDCLSLTMNSFITENGEHKFFIKEEKTGKIRSNIIPEPIYQLLKEHCREYNLSDGDHIFDFTARGLQKKIQRYLKLISEILAMFVLNMLLFQHQLVMMLRLLFMA